MHSIYTEQVTQTSDLVYYSDGLLHIQSQYLRQRFLFIAHAQSQYLKQVFAFITVIGHDIYRESNSDMCSCLLL